MRRFFVATIVILLSAIRASAAVVLDQQHNTATAIADSSNGAVSEMAQTFTVGVAGTLDHFELSMFQLGSIFATNGDPQLSVYNTSGGVPTGSALTTVQIPTAQVPLNNAAFVTFNVSAGAIPVTVGQVLAFSIFTSSDPGPYFWTYDSDTGQPDDYAAGAAFRRTRPAQPWQSFSPSNDHEFKTYVNAVAPPILAGDFNRDNHVNAADIAVMEQAMANPAQYESTYNVTPTQFVTIADLSGNGIVNNGDIQGLLKLLKTGGGSVSAVPEPSTALLLLLACAGWAIASFLKSR
jgi:hypothetical protein